jgi:hypothetical protein
MGWSVLRPAFPLVIQFGEEPKHLNRLGVGCSETARGAEAVLITRIFLVSTPRSTLKKTDHLSPSILDHWSARLKKWVARDSSVDRLWTGVRFISNVGRFVAEDER